MMKLYKTIIKGYTGHDDDYEHDNFKETFITSNNIDSDDLINLCLAKLIKYKYRTIALYCASREEFIQ